MTGCGCIPALRSCAPVGRSCASCGRTSGSCIPVVVVAPCSVCGASCCRRIPAAAVRVAAGASCSRVVNRYRPVAHGCPARAVVGVERSHVHRSSRGVAVFPGARAAVIGVVVVDIGVVYYRCILVDGVVAVPVAVVPVHVALIHVAVGQERPVVHRQVDLDVYSHPRSHWCPAVISAAGSPRYPCRCPFVSGNP